MGRFQLFHVFVLGLIQLHLTPSLINAFNQRPQRVKTKVLYEIFIALDALVYSNTFYSIYCILDALVD